MGLQVPSPTHNWIYPSKSLRPLIPIPAPQFSGWVGRDAKSWDIQMVSPLETIVWFLDEVFSPPLQDGPVPMPMGVSGSVFLSPGLLPQRGPLAKSAACPSWGN